ncbi:MAG: hypothetical protein F6K56_38180 [Moorea sp. SIO3G5]|nr:hypothetical protein [Moorena sp. SIO3G5]
MHPATSAIAFWVSWFVPNLSPHPRKQLSNWITMNSSGYSFRYPQRFCHKPYSFFPQWDPLGFVYTICKCCAINPLFKIDAIAVG